MKSLKLFATTMILLAGICTMNAQCTVTTPCGTYTYDQTSVSASSSSSDGVTTVTVSSNGAVIDQFSCTGTGPVSTSCTSTNGSGHTGNPPVEFDLCDLFAGNPFIAALLGCD